MRSGRTALLLLHLAVLLFGGSGLIGKLVSSPPLAISCLRSLIASVLLTACLATQRGLWIAEMKKTGWPAVVAGALLAVHWWTFFEAIQRSSVALGLLTFASYPLFAIVLGRVFLGEPARAWDLAACATVIGGLALVVPSWQMDHVGIAACLGLVSGLSFALLTIVNRGLRQNCSALPLVVVQTGISGLLLLPFASSSLLTLSGKDWLWLALLGTVFTGLAHLSFISSLARVRVATAGLTIALEPVYGIAFAWLLLGEQPSGKMLLGGCLIVSAAAMSVLCKHEAAGLANLESASQEDS